MSKTKSYKNYVLFMEEGEKPSTFFVQIIAKGAGGGIVETTDNWTTPEQAEKDAKDLIDSWEKKK
jgi:hypothetical protein